MLNLQLEDWEGQFAEFDKKCKGLEWQTAPLKYTNNEMNIA